MGNVLLVGFGGFLGLILRYLFSGYGFAKFQGLFTPVARAFLFTGFLEGFTTFPTFGNETMNLRRAKEPQH